MRTCPKCNYKIQNDNAKFCKNCGVRLGDLPVEEESRVLTERRRKDSLGDLPVEEESRVLTERRRKDSLGDLPVEEESRDNTKSMHSSKDGGIVLNPDFFSDDPRRRRVPPVEPDRPPKPEPVDLDIKRRNQTDSDIAHKKSTTKGTDKSMMWYVSTCFKKYATFKGRASRSEYWYFTLFNNLVFLIPVILAFAIDHNVVSPVFCVAAFIYMLVVCIPGIAVSVRRLHDIGKSGAYYFIGLIPYAGIFILLYYFCKAGDKSANLYGERP